MKRENQNKRHIKWEWLKESSIKATQTPLIQKISKWEVNGKDKSMMMNQYKKRFSL